MGRIMKMEQQAPETAAEIVFKKLNMKRVNGIWTLPSGYRINGNRVLLGTYERPKKTAGGVHIPDTVLAEEKNQGKSCLVLALGPTAFVSDDRYDFCGFKADIGEWVSIWVYEARPIIIEGHECRIARDTDVQMVIPAPDRIR